MATTLLQRVCSEHLATVRRAVDAYGTAPPEAQTVGDLKDLIYACLAFPDLMRRLNYSLWDSVVDHGNTGWTEVGESLLAAMDDALALTKTVMRLEPTDTGRKTKGWADLLEAIRHIEELREEAARCWPWFKPYSQEEIRESIESGESLDVDDAFAEIMGIDKETLRRKVEEHKRKYYRGQGPSRDAV